MLLVITVSKEIDVFVLITQRQCYLLHVLIYDNKYIKMSCVASYNRLTSHGLYHIYFKGNRGHIVGSSIN